MLKVGFIVQEGLTSVDNQRLTYIRGNHRALSVIDLGHRIQQPGFEYYSVSWHVPINLTHQRTDLLKEDKPLLIKGRLLHNRIITGNPKGQVNPDWLQVRHVIG